MDCKECSMLAIHVKNANYRNTPLNQRFYFNCSDRIENELHFVFDCTLYTDYRFKLFCIIHNLRRDLSSLYPYDKLKILFKTRQFAKYI